MRAYIWDFIQGFYAVSDFQGALKELIQPATAMPKPWAAPVKAGGVQLRQVRTRHKVVISMHMAGFTNAEIARELGYKPERVSVIINSSNPQLQEHRSKVENEVAMQMGDLVMSFRAESRKSLNTLVAIRDKEDAPLSEKRLSALAILDRAGYSPVKKQINVDGNVPFQELKGVIDQINSANEVAIRRDQWSVVSNPASQG